MHNCNYTTSNGGDSSTRIGNPLLFWLLWKEAVRTVNVKK